MDRIDHGPARPTTPPALLTLADLSSGALELVEEIAAASNWLQECDCYEHAPTSSAMGGA